jgi:hypothetical protein
MASAICKNSGWWSTTRNTWFHLNSSSSETTDFDILFDGDSVRENVEYTLLSVTFSSAQLCRRQAKRK